MSYRIQVITVPVSDVDQALAFYTTSAGFHLDVDYHPAPGFRIVQLTPPGSACSIQMASVGLTEAEARQRYGDDVATGTFPWVANARAVMQNETAGWVKSIHETRRGALLGLVMAGPHVTDMVEAGVIADSLVSPPAVKPAGHEVRKG